MNYITLKGYLRLLCSDAGDEEYEEWIRKESIDPQFEYHFETLEGEILRVWFKTLEQVKHVPINKAIALSVEEKLDEKGRYVVADVPNFYFKLPLSADIPRDRPKKTIGLFGLIRPWHQESEKESVKKFIEEQVPYIEAILKDLCDEYWDIEVRGFLLPSSSISSSGNNFLYQECKEYLESIGLPYEKWPMNYWHTHGSAAGGMCGWGWVGQPGSTSICPKSIIHELGHNFGCRHSGTPGNDYGDNTCVMGRGSFMNAAQRDTIGLENKDARVNIDNENRRFTLIPVESDVGLIEENCYQFCKIYQSGDYGGQSCREYYLSTRKFPRDDTNLDKPTLYLHGFGTDGMTYLLNTMAPGESMTLNSLSNVPDIKISYVNSTIEKSEVIVVCDSNKPITGSPGLGNDLPDIIPSAMLNESHSGLWYDPRFPGQGFDVHIKDKFALIYWYTHEVMSSNRRFFLGSFDFSDGIKEFDIFTTKNGSFADPTTYEEEIIGKGQFYFFDGDNGVFNYVTKQHGRGSIPLTRLLQRGKNNSGVWWDKERGGEGFTSSFFKSNSNEDRCWIAWYTYGPMESSGPFGGASEFTTQRWYILEGGLEGDDLYHCKIFEVQGIKFLDRMPFDYKEIGTATVKTKPDNLIVNFDITPSGLKKHTGIRKLTRFF